MVNIRKRIVVGLSGGGRTLQNILKYTSSENVSYEVVAVFASSEDCKGVDIAKDANLPIYVKKFLGNMSLDDHRDFQKWLDSFNADLIVLAGFLKKMPVFPEWNNKIINIHPALLPKYGGRGMYGYNVHKAVITEGERESGATVHFVNDNYDEGQIIAQAKVDVLSSDTPHELAAKVFKVETELYPLVIEELLTAKLPLANNGIKIYEF